MSGVKEAKAELERESVTLSFAEATPEKLIELVKGIFSKGYGEVELISKIGDAQIGYIELIDAGDATSFTELADDIRLNLLHTDYAIKDGILGESVTIQASDPKAQGVLDQWIRAEADYFNLTDEESTPPLQQIEALITASGRIADSSGELEKLDFILRPSGLHSNLLRALMEARGVKLERVELDG